MDVAFIGAEPGQGLIAQRIHQAKRFSEKALANWPRKCVQYRID
jgi:hypothetical protein